MKQIFLFLLAISGFIACSQSAEQKTTTTDSNSTEAPLENNDYQDLGKSMCKCLSPSLDLFKKQQELAQQQDLGGLKKLKEKQSEVIEEANKCISSLEQKYEEAAQIKEDEMLEVMKKSCPDIADYWSKL